MNRKHVLLLSFVICAVGLRADGLTQKSRDYALAAQETWSAFACSSLAAHMGSSTEQERLFLFAYKQGHVFIAAMEGNKITHEDVRAEIPMLMRLLLAGPTPDFMLGRIYEASQRSVLEDVFKTGDSFNENSVQKMLAETKFRTMNCQLIGR